MIYLSKGHDLEITDLEYHHDPTYTGENTPWIYYFWMVVKVKGKCEKTRHVKNNDKSEKYILRGERNVTYLDRILSNKKESYNFRN